ncbi:hypothetical protein [Spirosoma spitsbergense]|uniref:hypothetical protein n=1 Tax=Spirosoma spitsbergense TaxID=431554 RepID=UPI00037DE625|nr:hypothetical protein [Spirosoma spitsbergense]
MIDIIIVQIFLGFLLFFIINWIGKHSYSIGYMSISMFVEKDTAPALNFIIRVLSPVVYLLLVASIIYFFNLDKYTKNFYMVSIYYVIIRLAINLINGRGLLLNWYRQFLYWAGIILTSYYGYEKIIITKKNLIPDFTTLANELWIIIFIFLYQVFERIEFSQEGTISRKRNYIQTQYLKLSKEYNPIIVTLKNEKLIIMAYSILIYENFNRPYFIRKLENLSFSLLKKPHTLGIMQVYSEKIINDRESVILGVKRLKELYAKLIIDPRREFGILVGSPEEDEETINNTLEYFLKNDLIESHNGGSSYFIGISELMKTISDIFYKESTVKLIDGLGNNK